MYVLLTKGMANKNRFEGKWVNIIVAIAPIFSTSFDDRIPLIPLTILQQKSKSPT